jgi:hypothetical protein
MHPSLFMQPSQVGKLINANVSTAVLFAVVFFHYFPPIFGAI